MLNETKEDCKDIMNEAIKQILPHTTSPSDYIIFIIDHTTDKISEMITNSSNSDVLVNEISIWFKKELDKKVVKGDLNFQ